MSGNNSSHLLFFAHGMQVEVPLGTVLCFNPLSLSSDELRELTDVEVWVGSSSRSSSIIFQTKLAVFIDSTPQSLFAGQITFQSRKEQGQPRTGMKQIFLENSDWIEFLPAENMIVIVIIRHDVAIIMMMPLPSSCPILVIYL